MDIINRVNEFSTIAKIFADSGLFTDVKGQAQCFVKIMAGAEMGIPPFTAMNSFHIIQGKATLTAAAIAARVKASKRYDYHIVEKNATKCTIEFHEHGQKVYTESWDAARASKAGTKNMDKFPEAMLFARCITAGARAVAPDIVGQFYTAEELGAEVNEDGLVIDATVTPTQPPDPAPVSDQPAPAPVSKPTDDAASVQLENARQAWKKSRDSAKARGLDVAIEQNTPPKGTTDVTTIMTMRNNLNVAITTWDANLAEGKK